ncbi:MAG: D-glycerate dehydrogenase [Acidobacteria bacterium]|nr:D-glycerate dehydrogenase [Acidobacteriota bacterium]
MLPVALITWPFEAEILEPIRDRCQLIVNPEPRFWTPNEFKLRLRDAEIVACMLTNRITPEILDQCPKLRMIANVAVGYDNLNVPALRERCVLASNTPDVLTDATADLTMALILAVTRRVVEADRFTREGRFDGMQFDLFLGMELQGKTLSILGFGRIGRAVAARAEAFGMRILHGRSEFADNRADADASGVHVAGALRTSLEQVLTEADILTIHVPLRETTRHLINADRLRRMKSSAYLINTSRGPIVDESALAAALRERRLAGAGLDVYEFEPRVHSDLLALPNVVLLPHIGSATREARRRMTEVAIANISDYLNGRPPRNLLPELTRDDGPTSKELQRL